MEIGSNSLCDHFGRGFCGKISGFCNNFVACSIRPEPSTGAHSLVRGSSTRRSRVESGAAGGQPGKLRLDEVVQERTSVELVRESGWRSKQAASHDKHRPSQPVSQVSESGDGSSGSKQLARRRPNFVKSGPPQLSLKEEEQLFGSSQPAQLARCVCVCVCA